MALSKAIKSMKAKPATVIKKPVVDPRVVPPPRVTAPPRVAIPARPLPLPPRPVPLPRVTVPPRVSVPPRPVAPIGFAPKAPTPIQAISKDDPFYNSLEYKSFQNNLANSIGTMDMYDSPYFGSVGSGSVGRAQDEAYRKYKGIAEPTQGISNPPQFPNANFGNGLSEVMIRDLAGRYGLDANTLFGNFQMPQVPNQQMPNTAFNALFGNRQPQYPNQQMPNSGFANQLPITRFPDTNQPFMPPSSSPDGMTQYGENGIGYPASRSDVGSFGQPSNGMTQYRGDVGYPASRGYMGQPSTSYNQMNPMQQPMQGYQQQPMLPQSSYLLQQPQQPPQQSMYSASGGFGNTLPNQNQNQNIGGLFGAIESMNKNNFSY